MDNSLKNGDLKPYENTFRWKKRLAFLTTSLMVFVSICFIVAHPIRDFKTFVYVDVSTLGSSPENLIHQIIGEELADSKLSTSLAAANSNLRAIANQTFAEPNLAAVRDAFNFQVAQQGNTDRYRLTAEYSGGGTSPEQVLLEQVVQRIGSRLQDVDADNRNFQQFNTHLGTAQKTIEQKSSARHAELIAANSMVDRLNNDLSEIHNQVELFRPLPQLGNGFAGSTDSSLDEPSLAELTSLLNSLQLQLQNIERSAGGPTALQIEQAVSEFRDQLERIDPLLEKSIGNSNNDSSPMRVVNALLPEQSAQTASILKSLNELDTDNLRSKLGQIQQNLRNDAIQIRNEIGSLNSLAHELSENRIVVDSISEVRTRPTNPLPGWGRVMLFALAAIGIGAVTTLFYRPELDGIGFTTPKKVSAGLGLPIVAEFKANSDANENPATVNRVVTSIVGYGQIALFGFGLLAVLLCLLHSDLRTAFLEHPFYGLAKLTGMFFGN